MKRALTEAEGQVAINAIAQIKQLLAHDDFAAVDVWTAHSEVLGTLFADATRIASALQDCDFETAQRLMENPSVTGATMH